MAHFPLFLDLTGKDVLVVGAGAVGRRKIAALLKARPRSLSVADPALAEHGAELPDDPEQRLAILARPFVPEDLDGKSLVFAASNDQALNARVARLCAGRGILCNCAAPPEAGDCLVPAHFESNGIMVALSTGGQSPALARRLRRELEGLVASRYSALLPVMGRLRPLLLELGLPSGENGDLFRALVDSPLAGHLERRDREAAAEVLRQLLPKALHSRLGEVLHGI